MHWANADQYYVKTGEHFTDYTYRSGEVTVRFELTAADTEQNNVKGERRFFVPRTGEAAYDEDARTLTVPFEYRPLGAKEQTAYGTRNQQEKIIEAAAARPASKRSWTHRTRRKGCCGGVWRRSLSSLVIR